MCKSNCSRYLCLNRDAILLKIGMILRHLMTVTFVLLVTTRNTLVICDIDVNNDIDKCTSPFHLQNVYSV